MTVTQFIEMFHLIFLAHLEKKLDKKLYALKGGCNLRFFFKSIRYSEDIDLDVQIIDQNTLIKKIDKILENTTFQQNIKSKGLELYQITKPKQTLTTQRWKVSLKAEGHKLPLPTKIEFSRREMGDAVIFESIDPSVLLNYRLYPIIINHYTLHAAFEQKVKALIHRTETQARDIFDLKLLLDQGVKLDELHHDTKEKYSIAIENALNIGFHEFKSQVVSYLLPEYQSYYDSQKVWEKIQEHVIQVLERFLI